MARALGDWLQNLTSISSRTNFMPCRSTTANQRSTLEEGCHPQTSIVVRVTGRSACGAGSLVGQRRHCGKGPCANRTDS